MYIPNTPQTSTGISLSAPQRTATLWDAALGTGGHRWPAVGLGERAKKKGEAEPKMGEPKKNMATFGELPKKNGFSWPKIVKANSLWIWAENQQTWKMDENAPNIELHWEG